MTRRVPLTTGGEARYHDDARGERMQLDEVVTSGRIHLERMSESGVVLVIMGDTPEANVLVSLYADAPHRLRMLVTEGETK